MTAGPTPAASKNTRPTTTAAGGEAYTRVATRRADAGAQNAVPNPAPTATNDTEAPDAHPETQWVTGDRRKALMADLAVVTGGKFISEDIGLKLESVEVDDLGRAKKVVVDKDNTLIVEGAGKKKEIDARAEQIRQQIEKTTSDYDREK